MKLNEAVRAVLRARANAEQEARKLTGDDVVQIVMGAIAGEHKPPKSAAPDRIGRQLSDDTFADLVDAKRWDAFCAALKSLLSQQAVTKGRRVKPSPDVTIEQVARAGGVSVNEAQDAVDAAIEHDLAEAVGRGKAKRYRLSPIGMSMMGGLQTGQREARIAKARKTLAEVGIQVADEGEA